MSSAAKAIARPAPRVPILDDPEVREAFEAALRVTLEDIAGKIGPVIERARSLPEEVRLIPVSSEAEHEFFRSWLADEVDGADEGAKAIIDPVAGVFHRLHRSFTAIRALVTDETAKVRAIAKPKILAWNAEVERRRLEAEAQVQREREAAELRATIERAPYLAHVGIAQWAEIEQNEAEKREAAERARDAGDHEVADALADELGKVETPSIQPVAAPVAPPVVTAPVIVPSAPKGIAKNWKARVTDKAALIRFVADHPEYANLLDLNQSAADKLAKALEQNLAATVRGLEGFNDPSVRRTSR